MSERQTRLWYHLPKSFLTITGTVTTSTPVRGSPTSQVTTELALGTRADPAACYGVGIERSLFSTNEITLEVSEMGLLTSSATTSTGQLGTIFKNVASFAASIAGAAIGLPAFRPMKSAAPGQIPPARTYASEHRQRDTRRKQIATAADKLLETVIEKQESLATEADPRVREATQAHVNDLEAALTDLRAQAEPLDRHYAAWKAAIEQETTKTHSFELPVNELPQLSVVIEIADAIAKTEAIAARLCTSFPVYKTLGIVVARADDSPRTASTSLPASGTAHSGAFYRKVVPLHLYLFSKNASGALELVETETHDVIDEVSPPGYIEFKRNRWSKTTVETTFAASGTLTKLKHTKTSTAAAATQAAKELPKEVLEALQQADSLVDAQQKLRLQGIEHRIAELDQEKKELEAEIALGELVDSRELTSRLKVVKAEKDLLAARKELGEARTALEAQEKTETERLELEIHRLHTDLASSEKDLVEAQKELDAARQALAVSQATETIKTQTEILKIRHELEQAQVDRAEVLAKLRALVSGNGDDDGVKD